MNIFESSLLKVKTIFALNTVLSFSYIALYGLSLSETAIVICIFFLMHCLGMTVTYHRYYAHGSFKFKHKVLEYICATLGMISCSGSILSWAGIHRNHHKHSDTDKDPHQADRGLLAMISIDYHYKPAPRIILDLLKNKFIVLAHKYFFVPIFFYCFVLSLTFGFNGLILGFSIPAFLTMSAQVLTNYVNHRNKNKNQPQNVWWMNFLNFGDGWHKNHHDNPRSFTSSTKWYEIDASGIMIKHLVGKV
jgi:fatty-acid desaturase